MLTVVQLVKKYFDLSWNMNGRDGLQMWMVAANILFKQSRTAGKGWSSSLGVRSGDNNPSP
jgi:hypothetical protein